MADRLNEPRRAIRRRQEQHARRSTPIRRCCWRNVVSSWRESDALDRVARKCANGCYPTPRADSPATNRHWSHGLRRGVGRIGGQKRAYLDAVQRREWTNTEDKTDG